MRRPRQNVPIPSKSHFMNLSRIETRDKKPPRHSRAPLDQNLKQHGRRIPEPRYRTVERRGGICRLLPKMTCSFTCFFEGNRRGFRDPIPDDRGGDASTLAFFFATVGWIVRVGCFLRDLLFAIDNGRDRTAEIDSRGWICLPERTQAKGRLKRCHCSD
jgi:hypothetical protein